MGQLKNHIAIPSVTNCYSPIWKHTNILSNSEIPFHPDLSDWELDAHISRQTHCNDTWTLVFLFVLITFKIVLHLFFPTHDKKK